MATESDLRDLLRGSDPEGRPAIDLDAVLTRARRRRRPKVVAAQLLGSVAAVGALFVGVAALVPPPQTAMMIAEDSAAGGAQEFASQPEAADEALRWAMDACGEPPVEGASDAWAVETALNGTENALTATLTLRNLAEAPTSGTLTPWSLTFVRDGVVVGSAEFPGSVSGEFALGAGQSFDTMLPAVVASCDPDASLTPGTYETRAVVEVVEADGSGFAEVVYGSTTTVELR